MSKKWRSEKTKKQLLKLARENQEIVVLDCETSGLSSSNGRIIQIAAQRYIIIDNKLILESSLNKYIKPPFAVTSKIEELTGITNDFLQTQAAEAEVFDTIDAFLGEAPIIAAYNTPFDVRFIKAMYERNDKKFIPAIELDVLVMAKDIIEPTSIENFKLETVAKYYGVDHNIDFHSADDDVTVTSRLLQLFLKEYIHTQAQEEKAENTNASGKTNNKSQCKVLSMKYWKGYRGNSRIYVNTDLGTVFYEIRHKRWGEKDPGCLNIIDMEHLEKTAFDLAGATNDIEFARYRG